MQLTSSGSAPIPAAAFPTPSHPPAGASTIGKYLVSPLIRLVEDGWFASSVSIRSGTGSSTTDRVLRLPRLFQCAEQAVAYARDEAHRWISAPLRPLPA